MDGLHVFCQGAGATDLDVIRMGADG